MLYIVAAMEDELLGLRREVDARVASQDTELPLEFHVVGIGPKRAGDAMAAAIVNSKRRPQGVLMLGVAGAVEPGRETGELVLAGSYVPDYGVESAEAIAPDPTLLGVAESAAADARMPVYRSGSLTVDHLIAEGWERQQLREEYGVGTVNMEDYAVAAAARAGGIPFLSARVILDTAEQRLPGYLPRLSQGRSAVFSEVIARPWRIPVLLRLKSQMELCQSVLTRFGLSFIQLEAERRRSVSEKKPRSPSTRAFGNPGQEYRSS